MRRVSLFVFAAFGIIAGCSSSGGSGDTASSTPTPTSTTAAAPATTPSTTAAPAGGAVDGKALFAQNCSGCHGDEGKGGKRAPTLAGQHLAADQVTQIVTNGKGRMPAFGKRLSKDQIDALAQYVNGA